MKKIIFGIAVLTIGLGFTACKKDADGIILQAHDDNRMMDSMHVMMDRMEAMTMTMDPQLRGQFVMQSFPSSTANASLPSTRANASRPN